MNLASSRTVYAMSGRVQMDRYMHFPMTAAYGKCLAFSASSAVGGDKRPPGSIGVETELHFSYPNSRKMASVYDFWCSRMVRFARSRSNEHPRCSVGSPLSVISNCDARAVTTTLDSFGEVEAISMSSTLVVTIELSVPSLRRYTLQSDSVRVKPIA